MEHGLCAPSSWGRRRRNPRPARGASKSGGARGPQAAERWRAGWRGRWRVGRRHADRRGQRPASGRVQAVEGAQAGEGSCGGASQRALGGPCSQQRAASACQRRGGRCGSRVSRARERRVRGGRSGAGCGEGGVRCGQPRSQSCGASQWLGRVLGRAEKIGDEKQSLEFFSVI